MALYRLALEERMMTGRELLDGAIDVAQVCPHRCPRQVFVAVDDRIHNGLMLTREVGKIGPHIKIKVAHLHGRLALCI